MWVVKEVVKIVEEEPDICSCGDANGLVNEINYISFTYVILLFHLLNIVAISLVLLLSRP